MKLIIIGFILFWALVCLGSPLLVGPPPTPQITLWWDYDTNLLSTNLWFNFYETTNLTTPLTNWSRIGTVVGTNLSANFNIVPGEHFIVGTSSNFWGETSITSNYTYTPPLPAPINNTIKIGKSP